MKHRHRARAMLAAAIGATAVALASSCGTTRLGETASGPPAMSDAAKRGEVVFMQYCHKCHPDGEAGLGPAINGKPLPNFLIHFQVRNGLGAMPSFGEDLIDAAALDDLLAYLERR